MAFGKVKALRGIVVVKGVCKEVLMVAKLLEQCEDCKRRDTFYQRYCPGVFDEPWTLRKCEEKLKEVREKLRKEKEKQSGW